MAEIASIKRMIENIVMFCNVFSQVQEKYKRKIAAGKR